MECEENVLPLVTQVLKCLTLNKSYHCTILHFDTYLTHKEIHIQSVSVEAGARQITAVQRVFRSRNEVGIFDLIILHLSTAHNVQLRTFVHRGQNSCIKYTRSRIKCRTTDDKLRAIVFYNLWGWL
jgi:hypothetical protein